MKPGHDRVPPFRDPSPYMSAADIQAALNNLDPKLVASRTGGSIPFASGKAPGVVRRRVTGPQYAITHTRTLEYVVVTKGTATMVTGGTLIPPTIDSDPYPIESPDADRPQRSGREGRAAAPDRTRRRDRQSSRARPTGSARSTARSSTWRSRSPTSIRRPACRARKCDCRRDRVSSAISATLGTRNVDADTHARQRRLGQSRPSASAAWA